MNTLIKLGTVSITGVLDLISSTIITTRSVYDVVRDISKFSTSVPGQKNVVEVITKLDIELKVKIIESLLKEIPKEKANSETIKICVEALKDVIDKIEKELKNINTMLTYNNSLWVFKGMRSYNCEPALNQLAIFESTLNERKKLLFEVIQLKFTGANKLEDIKSQEM